MCVAIGGAIGAITSIIGTVVGAVGAISSANAQAAAATFRQKQEAMLAEDALKRGAQQEEAQRRKTSALYSRQKAVMAASNLDVGSGSALQILGDTAQLGELDAQVIKDNARRQENYHMANSTLSGMEAKSAKQAGAINAFSTVISGVSSLAGKWYQPASGGGYGFQGA